MTPVLARIMRAMSEAPPASRQPSSADDDALNFDDLESLSLLPPEPSDAVVAGSDVDELGLRMAQRLLTQVHGDDPLDGDDQLDIQDLDLHLLRHGAGSSPSNVG